MRLRTVLLVSAGVAFPVLAARAWPADTGNNPVRVIACNQRIEGPRASEPQLREARRTSITVSNLTLWGVLRARDASFGPGGQHDGWKAGVSVRGDRPVTLRVAARDRGWLALEYVPGRRATHVVDGDATVRFEPCPSGTRRFSDGRPLGPETAWAGAFVVGRRGCATFLVRRAGAPRSTRIRLGFGLRCA